MDKKGNIWYINEDGKYCRLFNFMNRVFDNMSILDFVKYKLDDYDIMGERLIHEVNNCKMKEPYILDQYSFGNEPIVKKHHILGNLQEITKEEIINSIKLKYNKIKKANSNIELSENIDSKNIKTDNIIIDFGVCKLEFEDSDLEYNEDYDYLYINVQCDDRSNTIYLNNIKEGYKIKVSYKETEYKFARKNEPHLLVEFIKK